MTEHSWPFDSWLKLAVRGFRLSPDAFWQMSLCDWLALTRPGRVQTQSADELSALCQKFPDEV